MTRLTAPLLLIVLFTSAARADDDPARLAPADVGVFIEVRDLTQLRDPWRGDPILDALQQKLPAARNPDAWNAVQRALDMTGRQIIDTYFSRQIVVMAARPGDDEPAAIFTRIDPADAKRVIDGLLLRKTATVGQFDLYEPEDRSSRFAFAGPWMVITDEDHEPFLVDVLESIGEPGRLADDPHYRQWIARLPAERQATAYVRGNGDTHAMALVSAADHFALHYAGQSSHFTALLDRLGEGRTLDFGPAPDGALFVAALNAYDPNTRSAAFIDRLITPRTFEQDVLPGLSAPLVMWLDAVPTDAATAPAFAAAVRLQDAQVDQLLDLAANNALVLANVAGMQWGLPPFAATRREVHGRTYHVAPTGQALYQRMRAPLLKHVDIAFGRTGDWYVVATHEHALQSARTEPAAPVAAAPDARAVARLILHSRRLAEHLHGWIEQARAEGDAAERPLAARGLRRAAEAAERLAHYETIRLSLDSPAEGEMTGLLEITRAR